MTLLHNTLKYAFLLAAIYSLTLSTSPVANAANVITDEQVIVEFDEPLAGAAEEVRRTYPALKRELEETFRWRVDFIPVIRLVRESGNFRRMVENGLIVAFAMPARDLIIIDYSRMKGTFTLEATLKHELCHLMLHHNIMRDVLPRWLDEGVCQWASGGLSEIIIDTGKTDLEGAVLSKRLLPLSYLSTTFPDDTPSLSLAYQESRSFIEYINNEFGSSGLLTLLEHLREGSSLEEAFRKSLSVSIAELERKWRDHLKKRITWITYVSNNVYEILFLLGGLLTIYGFVRLIQRRKAYKDEDGEDTAGEPGSATSLWLIKRSDRESGKED
jgi:hypothetical protein